jgi:LAO/AO transport system kinase
MVRFRGCSGRSNHWGGIVARVENSRVADGVINGDRRAVARAISMVENGSEGLAGLSEVLYPHSGRAHTVGLTGSPGVGKSSLAEQLVRTARGRERTVAVLAIDPTSPFTGGALLGDRLRMQAHSTDPGVFIRSMATRGHLGGMALAAPEAIRILDVSGKDLVIVETVGVGQAEVEVATAADTTLVILQPGFGDHVQAAKAGILEIADLFVVNKADRDGAREVVRDLKGMLRMGPPMEWEPPIVMTSAATGEGIDDLYAAVERHRDHLISTGELDRRRRRRILEEVEGMVAERLRARTAGLLDSGAESGLADDLMARRVDPYRAAEILLETVGASGRVGAGSGDG